MAAQQPIKKRSLTLEDRIKQLEYDKGESDRRIQELEDELEELRRDPAFDTDFNYIWNGVTDAEEKINVLSAQIADMNDIRARLVSLEYHAQRPPKRQKAQK